MKSIILVSPEYLEVCYNEALKYDFTIQGYGSFELAAKGLLCVNASSILGYAYLGNALPADTTALHNFLYRCNLCGEKKMLFAMLDTKGIEQINVKDYPNLSFSVVKIEEVVTDTVINRDIFGSILLTNYKPYTLKDEHDDIPDIQHVYRLQYKPVFNSYMLECLKRVNLLDSFEETLQHDAVFQKYQKDKSVLAAYRKHYIRTYFEANLNTSELYEILETVDNDGLYCVYRALIKLISANHAIKGGV